MASDFFRIDRGLVIDELAQVTTRAGRPDGSDEVAAAVGSLFLETNTATNQLNVWFKFQNSTNSIADWAQLTSKSYVDSAVMGAGSGIIAGSGLAFAPAGTLNVTTVNSSRIVVTAPGVDLALTGIAGGTYTKLTIDSYGRAVLGSQISGVDVAGALGYIPQHQDANLDALSGSTGTGIYVVAGPGTSRTRSIVVSDGLSIANADGVAGNPTISLINNLAAVEGLSTFGAVTRINEATWTTRTLVSTTPDIVVTDGDGVAGNPSLGLGAELEAVAALSGTGIVVRTGASLWTTETISGTANQIAVTNGDGVSGAPVISLAPNAVLPGVGAITLPVGSTANQPVLPELGMLRYNNISNRYEGYDGSWFNFAGEPWVSTNFQPLDADLTALANTTGTGFYVITGSGSSALRTLGSADSSISVSNGSGLTGNVDLTISATWPGSTSITTVGTITTGTWGGAPIAVNYGGTGLSTYGSANQVLGMNAAGSAAEYKTVTGGTGISVVPSANLLTIANTGVTSAVAGPGISVSGGTGPVTITNTGVLSVTAGAGTIGVSGTSAITISGPELYAENPQAGYVAPAATGQNAVAIGYGAIASADRSVAIGDQAVSRIQSGVVQSSGRFGTSGDAQIGRYVLRANTVSTFPSEAFVDGQGGSIRLVLPDNATWTFRVMVTAQRTDVSDGRAGFHLKGVIYRVSGAASTSLQGAVSTEQFSASNPWSVSATADTTNGSLKISFTGENGKTIRWVALVETVEVTD